ncbi:hypothetical protein FXO37_22453 [Capsicum annuum]|nr:hypothetical protein FXO37_22453 [Capsicum annuum]
MNFQVHMKKGEKAGSKGIVIDWDKLINDDDDRPVELVVTSTLRRLPAEEHQSISMDGEEGLSNLSNTELTDKIARLKKSLSGSIGARLPDGGEKLRANIQLHEDELELRKRVASDKARVGKFCIPIQNFGREGSEAVPSQLKLELHTRLVLDKSSSMLNIFTGGGGGRISEGIGRERWEGEQQQQHQQDTRRIPIKWGLGRCLGLACMPSSFTRFLEALELYRRWGRKKQNDLHRIYQTYNVYGRFLRIETWRGNKKSALIISVSDSNLGWSEIASKILRFLGKPSNPVLQRFTNPGNTFLDAVCKQSWPDLVYQDKPKSTNLFLSYCLVGTFNDPFNTIPKSKVIQKWFLSRWKITAGLRVTPISHNQFLFELPSRQEAERVKMGEWFWNVRRLTLEWWSSVAGTQLATPKSAYRWVRAFGIPLNAWSEKTMKFISDSCGGYVDADEDMKKRNHLYWARICITDST